MSDLPVTLQQVLLTQVGSALLAFDATRVDRIEELTGEAAEETIDVRDVLRLGPEEGPASGTLRRVLSFSGLPTATRLAAGEQVHLESLTAGALLSPPQFLASLWSDLGVEHLVSSSRGIALLINVDSLLANRARNARPNLPTDTASSHEPD